MSNLAVKIKQQYPYSYADYLHWPEEERWEIIDSIPYLMAPAPAPKHQRISGRIYGIISNFLNKQNCEVFYAPIDVLFATDPADPKSIRNIVQPDIVVLCDRTKIGKKAIIGAPDLIIEVVSPSTARMDFNRKYELYEKFGVKEYWIVHPDEKVVHWFAHDGKQFEEEVLFEMESETLANSDGNVAVSSRVLDGLLVPLSEIFRE